MAAVSTNDKVTVVRFDGVGARISGANEQYVYRTKGDALSYTTAAATVSALAKHPTISPARLEPLEPIGTGGGVSLEMIYDNDNALITALARRTIAPLKGALNEDVYTTAFVGSGDSTMVVSADVSSVLSVNELIWFGTVVAKVTSVSTTTVGISKGQLGSSSEDVPYTGDGVLIFTSWPELIGRRVTISEADSTTANEASETIIYRGVVEAVVPDGPKLTIRVKSRMQQMFGDGARKFFAPQSQNVTERTEAWIVDDKLRGGHWDYPRNTLWGDPTWTYHRLIADDNRWMVVKLEDAEIGASNITRYVPDSTGLNIIQMGRDEEVYSPDRWGELWEPDGEETLVGPLRAEYAWVAEDQTMSDILLDLLQGNSLPWSVCMRLQNAEIDSAGIAETVDLAADAIGVIRSPGIPSEFGDLFVMPYLKPSDERLADIMAEEFLGPLGLALTPDKLGVIKCVDFRQVFFVDDSVANADIKSGPIGATPRTTKTVTRTWTFNGEVDGTKITETVHSVLATMLHGGGRTKKYDVRILASARNLRLLKERARALTATYERAVPEGGFSVGTDIDSDVSNVLKVTCSSLPGDDGVRGSGFQRFFVTEWGKEPGGAPQLRGLFLGTDTGAKWAPAARVQSFSSGQLTCYEQVFTDPDEADVDVEKFEVGDEIHLLDQYGTHKVGPKAITAISPGSNKITVSGMGTAVDGDYIILAAYDDTGHDNDWTWLAGNDAKLGAAGDTAPVWT